MAAWQVLSKVRKGAYTFDSKDWKFVSEAGLIELLNVGMVMHPYSVRIWVMGFTNMLPKPPGPPSRVWMS